jgi:uncharacterized membrane protein YhaH (DUF805 family)
MIITKVENVYETTLPADVRQMLNALELTITLGLTGSKDLLTCMGLAGFLNRLTFWMITPVVLVSVVVLATLANLLWADNDRACLDSCKATSLTAKRTGQTKRVLRSALPVVVRLLFLVYPLVTNTAFEAFSCHEFKQDRFSVLIADVSIACTRVG